MKSCTHRSFLAIAGAALVGVALPALAAATTWGVPGDGSNTCTVVTPSCNTIAAAVTASTAGDTIQLAAGAHAVPATVILNKTLTITGAGQGATLVQPSAGVIAFSARADDLVLSDFTIENGATGVSFQSVTSSGTEIRRVTFTGQTSRGIDFSLGAATPVSNVSVDDCTFATNAIGIRMSSASQIANLSVTDSQFTGNTFGIYGANDGNTSTLTGLTVTGTTFTNPASYAIYVEELRDAAIEENTFVGGVTAIGVFKFYASNGQAVSNVGIRRNTFSAFTGNALDFEMNGMGLENPLAFEDNVVDKDVGIAVVGAAVFVRLHPTQPNAAVNLVNNDITLSGTIGPVSAAHAIQLRGNGPVNITGNVLDGGNVGGSGTTPATSGIFVQSRSGSVIMPATTVITATCNRIGGFRNGVSVFDSFTNTYGGLTPGATLTVANNQIAGNGDAGVVNGAAPAGVDAENNYWGCAAGPGNPGCDTVVGDVDAAPFAATPPACVACNADAQCNDGLACNGVETCDLGGGLCLAGTPIACDDGNACTTDTCVDPLGTCASAPVADGTSCDDGVTCSVPDTCQAGVCEGEPDTDMSGTCDLDEVGPLTVNRLTAKAQSGPGGNGKVVAKGTFPTSPPADTFNTLGPITVRFQAASGADQSVTFGIGTCITKGTSLPKIICRSVDRKSKALFKADKKVPNRFQYKLRLGALPMNGPLLGPATITLTYGPGTVRQGTITPCAANNPIVLKCKAP
ncbi:MAG: right-handed parallel beta-helix repeat-containing protein [bacterium]|nr:right-handed parallel beta-helix repeat-containing protein [bacterium]